jgi:hypothetical protein
MNELCYYRLKLLDFTHPIIYGECEYFTALNNGSGLPPLSLLWRNVPRVTYKCSYKKTNTRLFQFKIALRLLEPPGCGPEYMLQRRGIIIQRCRKTIGTQASWTFRGTLHWNLLWHFNM